MNAIKSLSIFFPCLNDVLIIPELIAKANNIAKRVSINYEIIVINDGSTDNTIAVLKKLQRQYSHLKFVSHNTNLGYGVALKTGFKNSKYEWVFYTDGDGQYDPNELIKLVEKVNPNIDVVNGYKLKRSDNFSRQIIGYLYNQFLHLIYPLPITDIDCDFRLIRKSLLKKIDLTLISGAVCLELVMKLKMAGARFTEVAVHHYSRPYGHSQFFKMKHVLKTAMENIRFYIFYLKSFN